MQKPVTHMANLHHAKKALVNANKTVGGTKIVPSFIGKKIPFVSKGSESKQ